MKSKTKISKQLGKKNNLELVETILSAKKHKNWLEIAGILSGPRKNLLNINLGEIDKIAKEGENLVIPGKVLSEGEIGKKLKIIALGFSNKSKEKLEKAKIPFHTISEEINKNSEAKDIRIIK